MKLRTLFVGALMLMTGLSAAAEDKKPDFISQLMAKMTVEEKLGQLNLLPGTSATTGELKNSPLMQLVAQGKLGTILNQTGVDGIRQLQDAAVKKSRLGIPLLIGMDVIHGYETIFPIPLGMSCSWDLQAIEQAARIAAKEATADGICWTYSPMVDIALDARWGRIAEGNGEDPFLGSRIAEALVRGYQGDFGPENMMACVKHYALYGGAEAERIHLKKGESRVVRFEITDDMLKFYDHNLNYVLEPGEFEIMIGQDSSLKHLKKAILIHN